jgi:tocopherol cyclase
VFYPLSRIWSPAMYQGGNRRTRYFEGWYFKLADAGETHLLAVIPGVSLGMGDDEPHCFVQVNDGARGESAYFRYSLDDFSYARDGFHIRVGPNRFSADRMDLRLASPVEGPDRRLSGTLRFSGMTPWPVRPLSPGIMGWYAFVPFMECYHGVVSLDHGIEGTLRIDGERVDYVNGRGYTEKDWGTQFPAAWVWMQSNHFERPHVSLTASVAKIPWLRSHFIGYIAGLWLDGTLYRFTTYTGAKLEQFEQHEGGTTLRMADRHFALELDAERTVAAELRAPVQGAMVGRVAESLTARIGVRLLRRLPGGAEELVFSGEGRTGGLELMDRDGILAAAAGR